MSTPPADPQPAPPPSARQWLASLSRLVAGQRLRFGLAFAALVAAAVLQYLVPLVTQATFDGVLVDAPPAQGGERAAQLTDAIIRLMGGRELVAAHLWIPGLVMVGITVVAGLFAHLKTRFAAGGAEAVARTLRDRLYDHIQRLPCTTLDRLPSGDVIQRATSDVETTRAFLAGQAVEIGRAVMMLVAPIPLMLALDWRMTLASIAFVPAIVGFSLVFFSRMRPIFLKKEEAEGRMTSTITENLTGIRVVRSFARQEFEEQRFGVASDAFRAEDMRLYALMAKFWSTSDLLCFLQQMLVVGVGLWLLATDRLAIGTFFWFITAVTMFIWPVRMMGRILADLGKAMVAVGRIDEILAMPEETDALRGAALSAATTGTGGVAVAFSEVRFRFSDAPGARQVLDRVSFAIGAGQTLGIVGPSGSGKSTIAQLLLRLYDYAEGSITVDGRELRSIPRQEVRAMIGTVMQQPFLYSRTLRANILISAAEQLSDDDAMRTAAGVASVHDSIESFPQRYDTMVGERGITLSGGQRQRVAIARSLVQAPRLLLLDDALSAVDTHTESEILRAFRQREAGHTTIIVAHRLSSLMHADRIIVLDRGHVVQSGTHEELVAAPGMYRTLWEIQTTVEDPDDLVALGGTA
jgi:ATP-binding cassette subfamily B protein